jgi:hypothetical protein
MSEESRRARAGGEHEPAIPACPEGAAVPVVVVASRAEAELVAGLLRSYDIRALVSADDAGGQQPQLQAEGVSVLVAPADEVAARQILQAAHD